MNIVKTNRILVRHLTDSDYPNVIRIMCDPEMMRYIRAPETSAEAVLERIAFWQTYTAQNPGLGVWAIESVSDQAFMGYCVFRHIDYTPGNDFELGYLVDKIFSGKGIATELTSALINYGFAVHQAPKIVAFTDPENAASIRVLEKNGFLRRGIEKTSYGISMVFEILNPVTN